MYKKKKSIKIYNNEAEFREHTQTHYIDTSDSLYLM